jgi:hypothetical protein
MRGQKEATMPKLLSWSLSFAVTLGALVAVGCGDDDATPGNDAGMDAAAVADAGGGMDSGIAVDAGGELDAGELAEAGPTCAAVSEVCDMKACCTGLACVNRGFASLCQLDVDASEACQPEGAPCMFGTACCAGTLCLPTGGGFHCGVEGIGDAAMMCGGLGTPCAEMPCCPGLFCVVRGPGMVCFDRP